MFYYLNPGLALRGPQRVFALHNRIEHFTFFFEIKGAVLKTAPETDM